MKRCLLVVVALGFISGIGFAQDDEFGFSLGAKVWVVDTSYKWPGSPERTGSGTLIGPVIEFDFPAGFWFSSWLLAGEVEFTGNAYNYDISDGEAVIGCDIGGLFDLGIGYRSEEAVSDVMSGSSQTLTSAGPLVYIGTGSMFGNSAVGWYTGASWMFSDMEEDYEAGEHVNVEGGLFFVTDYFMLSGGYRWRNHYDQDNDLTFQGGTFRAIVML